MNQESMQAASELLDALAQLLDESTPQELLPIIAKVASQVLGADAVVLELPGDGTSDSLRVSFPTSVSISSSAVRRAREEKKAILWNQLFNTETDVSKSILQNKLTSIMVAPFRTPNMDIVSGFLYLQRESRIEPFTEDDSKLFDKFVSVCEKIAYSAYDRQADKESLNVLRGVTRKGSMVYASGAMAKLVSMAQKLISLPVPVIIRGETGTGKEVFARWLHSQGPRADKPFVAINCGAIPENLIESILFGHVKGSFTGAIDTRKGVFEEAEGGTLFLDEIGELPMNMQVKLLRVLQEKHITRVGDNREIPVNVRIISATHVNLEEAVKAKLFREDLYFRIQVMPISIPPLRERAQDSILLAEDFLKRYGAEYGRGKFCLSRAAEKAILGYSWPGNVRELENRIQKALIQADRGIVQPKDLGLDKLQEQAKISPRTLKESREISDRFVIDAALRDATGNLTLAATILGIDRKVLRDIMRRLEMKRDPYRKGYLNKTDAKN
ncbi:MAG: sigma-54-dependent Fis family transcriptional regulator [Fibrobacteraceae bacterium]|nr:sigma-54-dependent Fis family transcriptional regulator [Fibrobacteraceae bacterium]